MKTLLAIAISALLMACAGIQETSPNSDDSLYRALGELEGIQAITNQFIGEIGRSREIVKHFSETDLGRFKEKFVEQICAESGGPCKYSGDSMAQVHRGMDITEGEFNATVNALTAAMDSEGIDKRTQNRLLKKLAPMRSDIIYR